MIVHRYPVSWYADKITRQEPFTLLMYGDGEFMIASGHHTHAPMAFGEVHTPALVEEMRTTFSDNYFPAANQILRASDPNIIDPNQYQGRDIAMMWSIHHKAGKWISMCEEWYDGVVWDVASREGGLGPFFKAVRKREVVLVGNRRIAYCNVLRQAGFVEVPESNAMAKLDEIEAACVPHLKLGRIFVLCMGLGGSLLAMRLRRRCPEATFLDLGSVFDVFARIGEQRGWRGEMYRDEARWNECIRKNLEGL